MEFSSNTSAESETKLDYILCHLAINVVHFLMG